MAFDVSPYLKEIARGPKGSRDLTREQARTLFAAVFAGEVSDLALGSVLVALRVKGESLDELAGMVDAMTPHVRPMRMPPHRSIACVIPSYNGSRKLPNLVPLLAMLIAREGVPVLVHGAAQEAARVDTLRILELLGHKPVTTIGEAEAALEGRQLACAPVEVLSPDLARLLAVRMQTGVRNSGHTLAKLLVPQGVGAGACRLIAVTHPDFMKLMRDYFGITPANAFLMRGVEGEPVVRLREPQPLEEIKSDGTTMTHLISEGDMSYALPERDAEATARWTRAVLGGELAPPVALARQAALVEDHCRRQGGAARAPLRLVSSK
jgi:anthranilate phosphoribosyltransferase